MSSGIGLPRTVTFHFLWEIVCSTFVALIWGRFAYLSALLLVHDWRLSALLILAKNSLLMILFLVRKIPSNTVFRLYPWIVAVSGTVAPFFLSPAGQSGSLSGEILQCTGLLLCVWAIVSLNRSFGIVPANRGIKKTGAYQTVRHPIYLSYLIFDVGYVLDQFSVFNLVIAFAANVLNVLRIIEEERLLGQDVDYQDYLTKSSWRLIPGLW